jgi:hypothetical protein
MWNCLGRQGRSRLCQVRYAGAASRGSDMLEGFGRCTRPSASRLAREAMTMTTLLLYSCLSAFVCPSPRLAFA